MKAIYPVTAALITTAGGFFYKSIYLDGLSVILIIISAIFIIADRKRKERYLPESENETDLPETEDNHAEELSILNSEIDKLKDLKAKSDENLALLYRILTEMDLTVPIINKLSMVITEKSEESTLSATEKIFSIAKESKEVSGDIQVLLSEMSTGDRSLESQTDRLASEVEDFTGIVSKVELLKKSYESDMGAIEKTVSGIKSLSDNISDIADQTSILAINASIEAARAGKAGVGFAVIAGETQKLARDSKQITEKITNMIKEIGSTIRTSFEKQSETLQTTVVHLQEAKDSFHQMAFNLAPQVKNIAASVQKSKSLSEAVTQRLNEITMSLQYQDATRQILEHIQKLMENLREKFYSTGKNLNEFTEQERNILEKEIMKTASEIFTVREEWLAIGLELDESRLAEARKEDELEGDITLF